MNGRSPPGWLARLVSRFARRADVEADIDDEISFHVDRRTRQYIQEGLPPDEARKRALRKFGNLDLARRSYRRLRRQQGRISTMRQVIKSFRSFFRSLMPGSAWNDIRIGWWTMVRHPRQQALPILVLALGIGLSTIALTLLEATLLAPYPFPNSSELHTLWATQTELNRNRVSMSLAEIADYERGSPVLDGIGYVRPGFEATLTGSPDGGAVNLAFANSGYFRVLGVPPELGRYFTPEEDRGIGAHSYAVISHRFWRNRLPHLDNPVGQVLEISNKLFTVVGVTPRSFFGPETVAAPVDVWVPVTMSPPFLGSSIYENRAERIFWTVFRASSPGDLARVASDAVPVSEQLALEYPTDHRGWSVATTPLREVIDGTSRRSVIQLVVAAAVVILLVSCVNVASLRLIAAQRRSSEAAIRLALGGTRGTLIRQHLAESLVVSLVAGTLGVLLSIALLSVLQHNLTLPLPGHVDLTLDGQALLISLGIVLGTSAIVGLVPALVAARQSSPTAVHLTGRAHGSAGRISNVMRRAVVVLEVAGTVVLLQAALVTLYGLRDVLRTPTGFQPEALLTMRLGMQDGRTVPTDSAARQAYNSERWEQRRRFSVQFIERAPSLPGIDAAAVWGPSMLGNSQWHARVIRGDLDPTDASNIVMAQRHSITPGALATAGVSIIAGRDLDQTDGPDSIISVVVDEVFASYFWPNQSPVGQIFYTFGGQGRARVVGVSSRAYHRGRLDDSHEIIGDIFFPYRFWATPTASVLVRGNADTQTQLASVRQLIREIDPMIGIYDVQLMEDRLQQQESLIRLPAFVMTVFGIIATVLAASGILAVVNHTLQTREREIGVQRALGLDGIPLMTSLLIDTAKPVVVGAAIGMLAGAVLGSAIITVTSIGGVAVTVRWTVSFLAFAGTLAVALVAGSGPVIRSVRLSPALMLHDG